MTRANEDSDPKPFLTTDFTDGHGFKTDDFDSEWIGV